jgi:hypothetical protein
VPAHAQLRFETARSRLYEMRFDPARTTSVDASLPGSTLLGTPKAALEDAGLAADLEPLQSELIDYFRLNPPLPVRVRNLSSARWPSVDVEASGLVAITFWIRRSGETQFHRWADVTRIPADLGPGEEVVVPAIVHSPNEPGDYDVVPCLTQMGSDRVRCDTDAPTRLKVPSL